MSVTSARKELVSQLTRFAEATDLAVKDRSKRAIPIERVSLLDVEADAQTVSDELLALRKPRRHAIEISVVGQQFKREIGETITLEISDFNPSSVDAIILNIAEDSAALTTNLLVWA